MKKLMLLTGVLVILLLSCGPLETIEVTFDDLTANGSSTQSTTILTLTFSEAITGLSADDITLNGVSGAAKGALSGSNPYTLQINSFAAAGTLNVSVSKIGYNVSPPSKTVSIFYSIVTNTFWAQSFKDGSFYQLQADKLVDGTYCTVWVEKGAGINAAAAQAVAVEYDTNIYPKMTAAFSVDFNIPGSGNYSTMELADAYTDGDGKLCILLLDIRDNYGVGGNQSAVGGYFLWADLYADADVSPDYRSNLRDMIYIDTNPGFQNENNIKNAYNTLAHEMQHLMNEITSQAKRNENPMDVWIDEGLSGAAEWVYSGTHPQSRWAWYHNNGNGTNIKSSIDKGNNFFVWGNRANENQYAEQDDYATAYLFFQWLRLQTGGYDNGVSIYKEIIGSANSNYTAVTGAASSKINSSYNNNWSGLLRDWLASNYINDAGSRYGYKNDATLKSLNKHFLTTGQTTALYPGEGVFSKIDAAYIAAGSKPTDGANIKYSVLTANGPQDEVAEGALLTYNANSVNAVAGGFPSPENGTVTGIASISVVGGRSVSSPLVPLSGPYWVSGGDVLRRNGSAGSVSSSSLPRALIRVIK